MKAKRLAILAPLILLLAGCGMSSSPSTQGKSAGEYFAKRWVSENNAGVWPSTEGVAKYCTDMEAQLETKNGWTLQQGMEYTDACSQAVVDGLK
jgi:hypothetical protein